MPLMSFKAKNYASSSCPHLHPSTDVRLTEQSEIPCPKEAYNLNIQKDIDSDWKYRGLYD